MAAVAASLPSAPGRDHRRWAPPIERSRLGANNLIWRRRAVVEAEVEGLSIAFLGMAFNVTDVGFPRVLIEGTIGRLRFAAETPRSFFELILERLAPGRAADMPGAAAACLLELALADVLIALEALGGAPIGLSKIVYLGAEPAEPLFGARPLGCRLCIDGVEIPMLMHLCDGGEAVFAAILDRVPLAPAPPSGLSLSVIIENGGLIVSRRDVAALEPGDVLVPEGTQFDRSTATLVLADRLAAAGAIQGSGLRLIQPFTPRQRILADGDTIMKNSANFELPDALGVDDIDVKLTFEIGRLAVPLAELASFGPGYIVDLGRDPGSAVDVLANGVRIGRGEIVSIGDRLSVRLMRLFRNG